MGFLQSTSGGTAAGANVATFGLTFPLMLTQADCLVIDIIWLSAGGTGDIGVLDGPGNTFTKIFSVQDASTGHWLEQYVALNIAPGVGLDTVVAAYTPSSGPSYVDSISMAIHEYTPVIAIDVHSALWTSAGPVHPSVTTLQTSDILHLFAATVPLKELELGHGLNAPGTTGWTLRETSGASSGAASANLVSWDLAVSAIGTYDAYPAVPFSFPGPHIGGAITALETVRTPSSFPGAWLIIDEPPELNPTPGYTGYFPDDLSQPLFLHLGEGQSKHEFTNTLFQRGTGEIPLYIPGNSIYNALLLEGVQVYLQDVNPSGTTLVFAGTVEKVTIQWLGFGGDHVATLSVVSFEQCFDTLLVPPQLFQYQTAASIFTALFSSVAGGVPLTLGTINANFVINTLNITGWPRLSEVFNQIAQAGVGTNNPCIWGVDLPTLTVYLKPPDTTASPYILEPQQLAYDSSSFQLNRQDYRNRQIIKIDASAFAQSSELFAVNLPNGGVPVSFSLLRPAATVTSAWLTNNTQNQGTATFSGQPAPGDTVTIGYPQSGSIYNWAPNAPYRVGQAIVDPANHIQVVTTQGTSGGSQPSWNDSGGTTTDGPGSNIQPGFSGAVIWQDQGLSGAGGIGSAVYTFTNTLDNTQWGQVLIGASANQTSQNLVDAINCNVNAQGQTFSWPTWENPVVNAFISTAPSFVVFNKSAGAGYIASLAASSSAFSWSGGQTSGGSTALGTYDLQVAANGSSNTANLYYTPGSNVVALASDPTTNHTGFIQVQYQRANGDCIVVENTAEVLLRAAIENGTGKYQQIVTDTSITSNTAGLQAVQSILAAYDTIPTSFSFVDWKPGLLPGQILEIILAYPVPSSLSVKVNGYWFVQEVTAELVPVIPWADQSVVPGGGHYKFTVTVINVSQVESYLAFWQGLGGGGGGGNSSLFAGAAAPTPTPTPAGSANNVLVAMTVAGGLLVDGVATPDLAQGNSFSLLLNNWTETCAAGISSGAASMIVGSLPAGVGPSNCPFTVILDAGYSSQEQVTVTGMSGSGNLTWAITRAQWGTTAFPHLAGFVVMEQFTLGVPMDTGGAVTQGNRLTLYLILPASLPQPGGSPLPNFTTGSLSPLLSGYASDTPTRVLNTPISFSGTAGTQTAIQFTANGNLIWCIDFGSSGGLMV